MGISQRKKKILSAVIELYIATAEPVGSKAIVEKSSLGLSSATIRNELSELTAEGYLEQPHTSAGRVPSPAGYRLYVNELMEKGRLSREETEEINRSLQLKMEQLDRLMSDIAGSASALTQYPAVALAEPVAVTAERFDLIYVDANTFIIVIMLSSSAVKNKLIRLPFSFEQGMITRLSAVFNASFTGLSAASIDASLIDSAELACGDTLGLVSVVAAFTIETLKEAATGRAFVTGASRLLKQPEYRDPDRASELMSFLSDGRRFLELPGAPGIGDADVEVIIGPENVAEELRDSSVVIARYNAGDNMRGIIGVVGPTRMDYSGVAAKLSYIAAGLSKLLSSQEAPPGFGKLQIKGDVANEP
ncbi:MAG: heat-inducible transcriptional repressor HrcA [Oscillospiraceae bacterium]|jgi:heat-inducible transcriptional repressor|nr:heat-inducible transcriptional repressor HrcA [Oscillospiraceae bacterium]